MQLLRLCGLVASASLAVASPAPRGSPTGPHHQARAILPGDLLPSYEYVVVGSGPGGGPLAARLAQAGKKVLLIDAGDDQGASVPYRVPALSLSSTEYTPMKWDYFVNHYENQTFQETDSKMTYQTSTGEMYVGLNPPPGSTPLGILYPRAGTLGGCSAHNALITIYPHKSDWTNIATITGDQTWAPSNMRKYFQRMENCEYLTGVSGHGYDGWLTTTLTDLTIVVLDPNLLRMVLNTVTTMGQGGLLTWLISTVAGLVNVLLKDENADTPGRDNSQALFQIPIAAKNGVRSGPRDLILDTANAMNPDGSRKFHLDILLNTLVTKVNFDTSGSQPRAVGVDFLHGQSLYRADPRSASAGPGTPGSINATAEVIVSAGSFNTPQLLKLSGVGPRAELESHNIPVIKDLPGVGTNLQDRYETPVIANSGADFLAIADCTFNLTPNDPCLQRWTAGAPSTTMMGVYSSNGIAVGITKRTSSAGPNDDPDIFLLGAPLVFKGYYPGYSVDATIRRDHWTWLTLKAHSRNNAGTVLLRSTDPRDTPIINMRNFNDPVTGSLDVQAVVEGMKFARTMFKSSINMQETWPGPQVATDAQLANFVRSEAWGHHASCTCPIGADSDPMAVLDGQFRVRGVQGLRVVDASVFPKIPGTFISVPVYMISEKAADVILGRS